MVQKVSGTFQLGPLTPRETLSLKTTTPDRCCFCSQDGRVNYHEHARGGTDFRFLLNFMKSILNIGESNQINLDCNYTLPIVFVKYFHFTVFGVKKNRNGIPLPAKLHGIRTHRKVFSKSY